ncbi:unnamed protein product [Fraxinus pennsylvanica]|uniref:WRKY domain-containing protein n=1 Tax=Fraxinus pennsylvanica TaxID=56036 RepID=A0AAD2E139_9LAMI|nr:unnamed protein product [Fraxinus pennsylvanica]
MAVDFLSYARLKEQIALQDHQHHNQMLDYTEISDSNVSKFRKSISMHNQIGHARFRRSAAAAPLQNQPQSSAVPPPPPPPSTSGFYQNLLYGSPAPLVTPDSTNHCMVGPTHFNEGFNTSPELSTSGNTSSLTFVSSTTGEGSVSNGKSGSQQSTFLIKAAPPLASSVKPSVSGKICHEHEQSDNVSGKTSGTGSCHCKKRKYRLKNTIRIPAISLNSADTPQDEYSWRKYGQKPIKGSSYPRGYYKCSTVKGCPARKHVERASDDPTMVIVTYEGEHGHVQGAMHQSTAPIIDARFDSK